MEAKKKLLKTRMKIMLKMIKLKSLREIILILIFQI